MIGTAILGAASLLLAALHLGERRTGGSLRRAWATVPVRADVRAPRRR